MTVTADNIRNAATLLEGHILRELRQLKRLTLLNMLGSTRAAGKVLTGLSRAAAQHWLES